MRRVLSIVCGIAFGALALSGSSDEARADVAIRDLSSEPVVTVFGATWCSACKALERELRNRGVPFEIVDVDQNPREYEAAKRATGKSVVPITRVTRTEEDVVWVVGSDADAVEKAYRNE